MNSAILNETSSGYDGSLGGPVADGATIGARNLIANTELYVNLSDNLRLHYGGVLAQREASSIQQRLNGNFTLLFVNHGTLHIHVDNKPFAVPKGQSILLWPDERFGGCGPNETELLCQWLNFEVCPSQRQTNVESICVPRLGVASNPGRVTELFRLLAEDAHGRNPNCQASKLLLFTLLSELSNSGPVKVHTAGALAVLAERARDYVRCNCCDPISSVDIAKAMDCSTGYLRKAFNVTYGYSPTEFLLQMRLHTARELLIHSRLCIGQIASQSGFESQSYFTRVFRRHQGMTPGEYRVLHSVSYTVPAL